MTFLITFLSTLSVALCLWKIGLRLRGVRLEENSSTLLFQIFHLRSFVILYIILVVTYTLTPWILISVYHL